MYINTPTDVAICTAPSCHTRYIPDVIDLAWQMLTPTGQVLTAMVVVVAIGVILCGLLSSESQERRLDPAYYPS